MNRIINKETEIESSVAVFFVDISSPQQACDILMT